MSMCRFDSTCSRIDPAHNNCDDNNYEYWCHSNYEYQYHSNYDTSTTTVELGKYQGDLRLPKIA